MGIGRRIKEAREARGYTQKELGALVGVTASSITNYENETSHPKEPILYKLLDVLRVDANFLFQDIFDTKKSSAPPAKADAEDKVSIETLTSALIKAGFITEDGDLSDEDLHFLMSVGDLISAWFAKGKH